MSLVNGEDAESYQGMLAHGLLVGASLRSRKGLWLELGDFEVLVLDLIPEKVWSKDES